MPCYRCGTRQVDPDRGSSPWLRGVRADRQVLICPGCQQTPGWTSDLDSCPVCSSSRLVRRLGEVECRDCGWVRESAALADDDRSGSEAGDSLPAGLAEEVERALMRVLRRQVRPSGIGETTVIG
jgi:hypothetical protein